MEQQEGVVAPEATGAEAPAVAVPEVSATTEPQEGNASPQPERRDIPDAVKQRLAVLARNESRYRREAAEHKARADYVEQQFRQAQNGQQPTQAPQQRQEPQFDPDEVMTQATSIATFNLKCNQIAEAGKKVPGFDAALSNLQAIGLPQSALEVVIKADDAPKVIAYLGQHIDEAAEILAKPPAEMAFAIAKLEQKLASQPAISTAPNPLRTTRSSGAGGMPDPKDTAAWIRWDDAREKEMRKR